MVLVEIDHVRLESPQRGVERVQDVVAGATPCRAVAHVAPELRREHDSIATAAQRVAEDRLAAALVAVDIRGVEERHVRVERGVHHCV